MTNKLKELSLKLEENILDDISRRIKKAADITDTAKYQIFRMKELGYSTEFIKNEIAKYLVKSGFEVEMLFFECAQMDDNFYTDVYIQVGKERLPYYENPHVMQWLNTGVRQTNGELKNFTRSMGFTERTESGEIKFRPIAKVYQDKLDEAFALVTTGGKDPATAIREATKSLNDSGLKFVDYAPKKDGGKPTVNHVDVAVDRAVRTGVSQFMGKIQEDNMERLETDIVEVNAHAGARPDHAEWQGRWYSFSGISKKYPSLVDVTGYGTGAGLKGWNCRHDFYPVIEGVSTPAYTDEELANIDPPPIEWGDKEYTYYECTQKQRNMERAMRKTKRELITANAAEDKDTFTQKSIFHRRQKDVYNKFSEKANLLTQYERTQVNGFDRSVAQKAVWAERKVREGKEKAS